MDDKKKPGRGQNPNSRKNLKPIQVGEVRNPEGGRAHNEARRVLKNLTTEHMKELLDVIVMGNLEELEAIANDPNTPNIQRAAAYCFESAMRNKDWDLIEKIITRIVGKVPDKIDHTSNGGPLPGAPITIEFVEANKDEPSNSNT